MISYEFHIIQKNKDLLLINHKLTPLILDKDFNIWLALCLISLTSNDKAGNIIIRKKGAEKLYRYDIFTKRWNKEKMPELSNREKEVLILSGQGLTMEVIANILYVSIDTIKFHKRNIFRKLSCKNISEAILAASNYAII